MIAHRSLRKAALETADPARPGFVFALPSRGISVFLAIIMIDGGYSQSKSIPDSIKALRRHVECINYVKVRLEVNF